MKTFSKRIDEMRDFYIPEIGDRIMIDGSLEHDRKGQFGDVVWITKNGDIVIEFGDGGAGIFESDTIIKSEI